MDLKAFQAFLADYTPEKVEGPTGVPAKDIRTAARWFARKGHGAISLWTMGLNQRTKGVHLNCQVHNLHLLTGKIGRPGSDSMSLTGQPNACGGTREQGGLTHILPGHRAVANAKHRAEIAKIWDYPVDQLPKKPTGPAVNMFMRLADKKIKAIWINTTNPGQSLPNLDRYREAMRDAFTVVSDVYPTRTTELASVILPSSLWVEKEGVMGQTDRRSQLTPKLVDPPAGAKADFWQIVQVATRVAKKLGRKNLGFQTEAEAWDEYRACTKDQDVDLWGATREKLKAHAGGIQWPCPTTDFDNRGSAKRYISKKQAQSVFGKTARKYKTGYVTLYDQHMEDKKLAGDINYYGGHPFHKESKSKAIIRVLAAGLDFEMPDKEYPYVLNTGRVIEHWHSGTMTMRARLLRDMNPNAYVEVSPTDAKKLGVSSGQKLRLESRRGSIVLPVWVTKRAQPGMVFVPWFDENLLINKLTVDDPKSWSGAAEPDYKVCAVRLKKV
jgi:nitrate reductase NapA